MILPGGRSFWWTDRCIVASKGWMLISSAWDLQTFASTASLSGFFSFSPFGWPSTFVKQSFLSGNVISVLFFLSLAFSVKDYTKLSRAHEISWNFSVHIVATNVGKITYPQFFLNFLCRELVYWCNSTASHTWQKCFPLKNIFESGNWFDYDEVVVFYEYSKYKDKLVNTLGSLDLCKAFIRSCLKFSIWCSPILGTTSLPTTTEVTNSLLYSTADWLQYWEKNVMCTI